MQEYVNGKVLLNGKLVQKDFLIKDSKIYFTYDKTTNPIDLTGKVVAPGFVDVHVHTRTPGYTHKEDIEHVTKAALKGGFTTIVAMSNINPMPTDEATWKGAQEMANKSEIEIIQSARVTKDGKVTDFEKLSKLTNCFTDDGMPIDDEEAMEKALEEAKKHNVVLMLHEEDHSLKGVAYTSNFTKQNNLPSFGSKYEWRVVERDINLNWEINAPIHLQHISTKETIELLEEAKDSGMRITAELTPHHIFFNNDEIINDGKFKMNPPLGSKADQVALIRAFEEELVDIIATDHAPHTKEEKSGGFEKALNGIIGLETAFAACNTKLGEANLERLLRAMSINPAKLIGKDIELKDGKVANLVIIDPNKEWTFTEQDICSKSHNSPWIGLTLKGKVEKVIYSKEI